MKHVIVTDSEIDGLGHDAKNVHQLPDATPDDYNTERWEVDQYDDHFGVWYRGSRGGEVNIRRTDGRISITSFNIPTSNSGNARRLALALLAAADRWDELFPNGVTDEALKKINDEYRARWQ